MRVVWTEPATDDLTRIVEYIREDNRSAATRVARTIYEGVAQLKQMPERGRIGLAENTRELIFSPWPYIAVYEVSEDKVTVLRIRHTSQNWP